MVARLSVQENDVKSVPNILLALTTVVATTVLAATLTMPPNFTGEADREAVLRAYPLGTSPNRPLLVTTEKRSVP